MKQVPLAIGLLLCEQVIVEEHSKNATPVNCFSHRFVRSFPSEPVPFVAFAMLTDGRGEMPLIVQIHRLDSFQEVFRSTVRLHFADPLQVYRCLLRIRNWSAPVSGRYQVSLVTEYEVIAQRIMVILQREESP